MLCAVSFATPFAGFLGLLAFLPIAVGLAVSRRNGRIRRTLQLPSAGTADRRMLIGVAAGPLLLALAATGPTIVSHTGRLVRTDAQAIFVFDTSRSMAAAASFVAPTRLQQAQRLAVELRDHAIPDVPAGVASLTTELLPHLFPTADEAAFAATAQQAIGIERPPPPFLQYGVKGTSFAALSQLRNQGFFSPSTSRRIVVLLTDGESGPIDTQAIGEALTLPGGYPPRSSLQTPGLPSTTPERPVSLVIVRFGAGSDRIYNAKGAIEAAYRPDPNAAEITASLAAASNGSVFTPAQQHEVAARLRAIAGSGSGSLEGVSTKAYNLAPFFVLAAVVPLGVLLWRRYLSRL